MATVNRRAAAIGAVIVVAVLVLVLNAIFGDDAPPPDLPRPPAAEQQPADWGARCLLPGSPGCTGVDELRQYLDEQSRDLVGGLSK